VQHVHQDVGVRLGQRVGEEAACSCDHPFVSDLQALDHLGQIEEHPCCRGRGIQDRAQQVSAAPTDVHDRGEPAEVVGGQHPGHSCDGLAGHRVVEHLGLIGMLVQVGP
jgi:hypothetical protein